MILAAKRGMINCCFRKVGPKRPFNKDSDVYKDLNQTCWKYNNKAFDMALGKKVNSLTSVFLSLRNSDPYRYRVVILSRG